MIHFLLYYNIQTNDCQRKKSFLHFRQHIITRMFANFSEEKSLFKTLRSYSVLPKFYQTSPIFQMKIKLILSKSGGMYNFYDNIIPFHYKHEN